jgi:hypothetical protein
MFKRIFITYTKQNPKNDEVYSGRASGEDTGSVNDIDRILAKRDSSHHKNEEGFGNAEVDRFSNDGDAIRGQEQRLIDFYGGAKSEGGTSGNTRNGIGKRNKKRDQYLEAAIKLFGSVLILLAIFFGLKNIL